MKALLAALGVLGLVLAWGFWHARTHAAVTLRVDDYALKSQRLAYGTPHDVTLQLLGPSNEPLATARSVEPLGYILPVHPGSDIGNCEQRGHRASGGAAPQGDYVSCYAQLSAWASQWAPRVRRADVRVGACEIKALPVRVHSSNTEWWLWWVPLPHVGGRPRQYFEFVVAVDSRACAGVASP